MSVIHKAVVSPYGVLSSLLLLLAPPLEAKPPMSYLVDLRQPGTHLIQVTWTVPEAAPSTEIQFPAWNATYQIRDLVRHVQDLTATCDRKPVRLARVDLDTWRDAPETCASLEIHYAVFANEEGPFGTALNETHAFLNLAMVLFYLPEERGRACRLKVQLPEGWKLASMLGDPDASGEFQADDYDTLADSPAEAGTFQEYDYEQQVGGPDAVGAGAGEKKATYRVIVHADSRLTSPGRLLGILQNITSTETALMHDAPFCRYTFILHFTSTGGRGGMEHKYGAAISLSPAVLQGRWDDLAGVAAHEFFHLWNVKRIRPQALEPVDYVHGNDTRDLWFCEGVTVTYAILVRLRAGVTTRHDFFDRLAEEIGELQGRSARQFQSVELSGEEAWLEKYPDYSRPERSISYYNKGALVGFLLDLAIRHFSDNHKSLDDLMRRLNEDFAKRGRYFTLADLRTLIVELAPRFKVVNEFFRNYISGTTELDYGTYLDYAGLKLKQRSRTFSLLGFQAIETLAGPTEVESVQTGSDAERAGLRKGDVLVTMNGELLTGLPEDNLGHAKNGELVEFRVRRGDREFDIKVAVRIVPGPGYSVEEIPDATPNQRRLRDDWLEGKTEP